MNTRTFWEEVDVLNSLGCVPELLGKALWVLDRALKEAQR